MALDDVKTRRAAKQAKSLAAGGFVVCKLSDDGFAIASAIKPFPDRASGLKWLRRRTGGEISDFDNSDVAIGSQEKREGRMFFILDDVKSFGHWNKNTLKDAVKEAFKVADVKAPMIKILVASHVAKKEAQEQEEAQQQAQGNGAEPANKAEKKTAAAKGAAAKGAAAKGNEGLDEFFDNMDDLVPVPKPRPKPQAKPAKKPTAAKARTGAAQSSKKGAGASEEEETVNEITVKASLGIISSELAELILAGAPSGSWLIRFDERSGLYVLASKYGGRVMHRPTTAGRGAKVVQVTRKKTGLLIPGRGPLPLHKDLTEEDAEARLDRFGKWLIRQGEGGKRILSLNIGGVIRHSSIGSIGAVKLVRSLKLDVAKAVLP